MLIWRGFSLTADVEVNELTSVQRLKQRVVRRTAEVSASLFRQEIQLIQTPTALMKDHMD